MFFKLFRKGTSGYLQHICRGSGISIVMLDSLNDYMPLNGIQDIFQGFNPTLNPGKQHVPLSVDVIVTIIQVTYFPVIAYHWYLFIVYSKVKVIKIMGIILCITGKYLVFLRISQGLFD